MTFFIHFRVLSERYNAIMSPLEGSQNVSRTLIERKMMSLSVDVFACCILTSNSQEIDSDLVVSCIISLDVFQTDFKVRLGYTLVNTKRFIKKSYQNITTTCTVLTRDGAYDLVISSNI